MSNITIIFETDGRTHSLTSLTAFGKPINIDRCRSAAKSYLEKYRQRPETFARPMCIVRVKKWKQPRIELTTYQEQSVELYRKLLDDREWKGESNFFSIPRGSGRTIITLSVVRHLKILYVSDAYGILNQTRAIAKRLEIQNIGFCNRSQLKQLNMTDYDVVIINGDLRNTKIHHPFIIRY